MLKSAKLLTLTGACALLAVAGLSTQAFAATSTSANTHFQVQITIQSGCDTTLTQPSPIDFGSVNSPSQATQKSTSISIQCTEGSKPTISLQPESTSSTDGTGYMSNSGQTGVKINYSLWQDSTASTPWGTGATANKSVTATGSVQQIPVYATVNSGQTKWLPAATYSDTVDVTVSF